MDEIVKKVRLRGTIGDGVHEALIDTGTRRCVVPRPMAEQLGLRRLAGKRVTLRICGHRYVSEPYAVDVEILRKVGSCRAEVEALVPVDRYADVRLIVGSRYLQNVGATIRYKGDHPVFCEPSGPIFADTGVGHEESGKLLRHRSGHA